MPFAPGSRLGRYKIVGQLGAGAMGEVYLAEDPHIERQLAIKTVRLDVAEQADEPTSTQLRLRFQREAKVAGRLVHPHVVTLFDAGETDGVFFLVFEFIDGTDLEQRIRRPPPLTLPEILRIGLEAAAALNAAHRRGIVHRDIKPANLLLTNEGTVKVADFGIASLIGQKSHLTKTGLIIGTPQYLSPEQVRGETPLDGRTDLFSLGVVLYELLAGRRPFVGPSLPALLFSIASKDPPPLQELRDDIPQRLSNSVMRLLEKDPDQRFASASDLGEELALIAQEVGERPEFVPRRPGKPESQEASPTLTLNRSATPARRSLFLIASLLVLLFTAGILAVIRSDRLTHFLFTDVSADDPQNPADENRSIPPTNPLPSPQPSAVTRQESQTATEPSIAEPSLQPRRVGGAITFSVSPAEAANRAVVSIDGLVRGLATGSIMTLRPGRHEIVVDASGFESARLVVESQPDGTGSTEIELRLDRREPPADDGAN